MSESKKYFETNLDCLKKHHPHLYTIVSSSHEDPHLRIETGAARSGDPYLFVHNIKTGRRVYMHNAVDPRNEAKNVVDSMEIEPGQLRFLLGFGLGYVPLEIVSRNIHKLKLAILEHSVAIFKKALEVTDLRPVLSDENIAIFLGQDFTISPVILKKRWYIPMLAKEVQISTYEPARELFPDQYGQYATKIKDEIKHCLVTINTSRSVGKIFFQNNMYNLTTAIRSANLGALHDVFKRKPVMVVGAGPSLSDVIPDIKKHADRVGIIAVDSALPPLLKNGIVPDVVATVDFHSISFEKYRDVLEETERIPLVYTLQCSSMTLKPYRCPYKFFIAQPLGFIKRLSTYWKYWAKWAPMEAVSHLALYTARVSGADPVILAGLDLAYTGLKSYVPGTSLLSNINIEELVWVDDYQGNKVPTSQQMVGQREIIEQHIATDNNLRKYFNVSKGVAIRNSTPATLDQIIEECSPDSFDFKQAVRTAWERAPKPDLEVIIDELKHELKNLDKVISMCHKGLAIASKAQKSLRNYGNSPDTRTLVKTACIYFDDFHRTAHSLENAISNCAGQDLDLLIEEYSIDIDENKELTELDKVTKEINLIKRVFEVRVNAAKEVRIIFSDLYEYLLKMEKLYKKLDSTTNKNARSTILCKLGNIMLNFMDFVPALDAFEQAIMENPQNANAWLGKGLVLGKTKQHTEALSALEKAYELNPGSKKIKEALEEQRLYPTRLLAEASKYMVGDISQSRGQGQELWALRLCNEVLKFDPENQKALELKIIIDTILEGQKKQQEEILTYVFDSPENAVEKIYEIMDSEPVQAERILKFLKKLHPYSPSILEAMGIFYLKTDKLEQARHFLYQAKSVVPHEPSPWFHLASVASREGNYEEALDLLMQARDRSTGKQILLLDEIIGDVLCHLQRYQEAVSCFERIYLADPSNVGALKKIGNCYKAMGNPEAAVAAFEAVRNTLKKN